MDKIFSSLTWILRRLRRRKEATDTPAGLRSNKKSLSLEPSSDSSVERRQRNISQSSTFSGEERRREESRTEAELEGRLDCDSVSSQADSREASLGSAGLERRSLSLSSNLQRRSDLAGSLFLDLDWSRGAGSLSRELDHIKLISHNLNLPPPPGSYCVAKYKYSGVDVDELSLSPGDILRPDTALEPGWWAGQLVFPLNNQRAGLWGVFPANYVCCFI